MADALGPLPALDGQASPAGFVAVDPAGCVGEGWRRGEAAGQERARRSQGREREPPREEAGFGAGWRERDRVKQGERRIQKGWGERQGGRREGGASPRHADAGTLAHTHSEAK